MNHSSLFQPGKTYLLDGAMGTAIQARDLTSDDFGGPDLDGCNEWLIETRPDVIEAIHTEYYEAGCDLVETNTFGANRLVLAEYDKQDHAFELNQKAAALAKKVAKRYSTPEHPRYVAGSIGPGTKLPTLGHINYDALKASYAEQISGLMDGGVDVLLFETCQDLLQVKAALAAAEVAFNEADRRLPIMVQVTIEQTGTMLVGSEMAAVVAALESYPIDVLGMNCATGPREMEEHIRTLSQLSPFAISCVPNAGLPENRGGHAHYHLEPSELADYLTRFVEDHGVQVIGGCCGTTPKHIKALAEIVSPLTPKLRTVDVVPSLTSLYSPSTMTMEPPPVLVGERTNANGSKKFKNLLAAEDYDALVDIGKGQVRKGAHLLDVCTAYVGRDEERDMTETIQRFNQQLDVPLMIDSTEANVIEKALKLIGGRAIVNSINLEDGEERMEDVLPLCKEFGAAVVALTIDEEGMAKTAQKKFDIAKRIYDLSTEKFGLRGQDLVFDTLTFTLGSGDEEFRKAGIETIEALRLIHSAYPEVGSVLGISNISFGLDKNARHVLNSVFMHEAIQAGLTMAIVNSAHIIPLNKISDIEKKLCLDLIYDRREWNGEELIKDPLMDFISYYQTNQASTSGAKDSSALPEQLEERLQARIIDGNKTGLNDDLDEAMKTYKPLEIINKFLLEGMKVVGDLFGKGEMQLPFVLQSAETMKKAVAHLEPHMDKTENTGSKGVCVLATVKGDVHDIGKNLVDILLTNNGYTVHNLGIKQAVDAILEKAEESNADCIAMSGLLVKSTAFMKENLQLMQQRGWKTPVILGGAALTQPFVERDCQNEYDGPVIYARSAFDSLHTMDDIMSAKASGEAFLSPAQQRGQEETRAMAAKLEAEWAAEGQAEKKKAVVAVADKPAPRTQVAQDHVVPTTPLWGTRISEVQPEELYGYLNETVIMTGHWGFRRGNKSSAEHKAFLAEKVKPILDKMKRDSQEKGLLSPKVIDGFFPAQGDGDSLVLFEPEAYAADGTRREMMRFDFPRGGAKNLCLTDFFRPYGHDEMDVLPMQIVTVGEAATEYTKQLFANDDYTDYFFFHGFAVEMAEALAEEWHRRVRRELNVHHKEQGKTGIELLRPSAYQGCRYSFGYPACPELSDQTKLFELLKPERIGLQLTESFLMEPEQSTSALVLYHPDAYYFDVRDE